MVALVATSCASTAASSTSARAGTLLLDGFRVPTGSHRMMPMMPCSLLSDRSLCADIVGVAVLQIDGRPDRTLNALLDEGRRLGFRGGVDCSRNDDGVTCNGEVHEGRNVAPPTTSVPDTSPTTVASVAPPSTTTLPVAPGRDVRIELHYGVGNDPRLATAALTLRFATIRPADGCETKPTCTDHVADFHVPVPALPRLPRVGEIIDPLGRSTALTVVAGTRVIARLPDDGSRGGGLTVIGASGDLDRAAARYRDQAAHNDFFRPASGHETWNDSGWSIDQSSWGGSEGPTVYVMTVHRGPDAFLVITVVPYG